MSIFARIYFCFFAYISLIYFVHLFLTFLRDALLQPLLDAVLARGVSLTELALAAGLSANALSPLPETLAAADYVRLLDTAAQLANDPHFGLHVGESVKLGNYTVYGLILLSCHDFGQVFQQTLLYEGLAHDLDRSDLQMTNGIAQYQ